MKKVPYPETVSEMFERQVNVNCFHSPQEMINNTGRIQNVNARVLKSLPIGEEGKKSIYFFKLNYFVDDVVLDQEYKKRRLKPVDPYSLIQVNTNDPAFADKYPNCTHWKSSNNNWCFINFSSDVDGRNIDIDINFEDGWTNEWSDHWWYAGVRI